MSSSRNFIRYYNDIHLLSQRYTTASIERSILFQGPNRGRITSQSGRCQQLYTTTSHYAIIGGSEQVRLLTRNSSVNRNQSKSTKQICCYRGVPVRPMHSSSTCTATTIETDVDENNNNDDDSIRAAQSDNTPSVVVENYIHNPITKLNNEQKIESDKIISSSRTVVVDTEKQSATILVDKLLHHTNDLLHQEYIKSFTKFIFDSKIRPDRTNDNNNSIEFYDQRHQHTIAFSGGVDSSLVAALVYQCNHNNTFNGSKQISIQYGTYLFESRITSSVQAVMGISAAVPFEQIQLAEQVANAIGIDYLTVPTTEGTDETYIANAGQACFACKTHLYLTLQAISNYHTTRNQHIPDTSSSSTQQFITDSSSHSTNESIKYDLYSVSLYNGTNADDVVDPTRVGLIAASNYEVVSPIQHLSKEQVRVAAKHLNLPNWNYASNPCLRSRIQLGVMATTEHLQRIETAERYVREQMSMIPSANNFTEASNLRVRLLSNNRACIEIDTEHIEAISNLLPSWEDTFINQLHFHSVHTRPFRSGSVSKKSI